MILCLADKMILSDLDGFTKYSTLYNTTRTNLSDIVNKIMFGSGIKICYPTITLRPLHATVIS